LGVTSSEVGYVELTQIIDIAGASAKKLSAKAAYMDLEDVGRTLSRCRSPRIASHA